MLRDSELCEYGNRCERILCMYKHKDEESILDSTTAVDKSDINKTFQNPYIIDIENCEFVTTARSDIEEHTDEGEKILSYL